MRRSDWPVFVTGPLKPKMKLHTCSCVHQVRILMMSTTQTFDILDARI
jgi:hypothetical protein